MSAGRIVGAVAGAILALVSIGLLAGGVALVATFLFARDSAGFVEGPSLALASNSHAIASPAVRLATEPGDWWPTGAATLRVVASSGNGKPAFVGIGPTDAVDRYLQGVSHDVVEVAGRRTVTYRRTEGGAPAQPPAASDFWVARQDGSAPEITWEVVRGDWTLVVMNADGSPGVAATTAASIRAPAIPAIGVGIALAGIVVAALSAVLLILSLGTRNPTPRPFAEGAGHAHPLRPDGYAHPVVLEGRIDEPLRRWLWLVKWLLAIPHFIVLALLWPLFVLLTVAAFVAIVATRRYPRAIFDFNVGVLRWTWRVGFYCIGVLATDRYPPFTLAPDNYPAQLHIAYPERLSRGLPFVKWLLALPHLIIIGFFTSGLVWWGADTGNGDRFLEIGGGLIGVLALVAGIILLFSGRYPVSLFDLLMGFQRWVYRVIAYVALMRDEYPPFRLDAGPTEPPAEVAGGPDIRHTPAALGARGDR